MQRVRSDWWAEITLAQIGEAVGEYVRGGAAVSAGGEVERGISTLLELNVGTAA